MEYTETINKTSPGTNKLLESMNGKQIYKRAIEEILRQIVCSTETFLNLARMSPDTSSESSFSMPLKRPVASHLKIL